MGIDRTALSAAMKQLPATPRATLAHPPSPESHPLERSPSPASHPRKRRREEDSDDNESSDDDENNNTTHRLTPSTPGHSQATPGTSQSQVPDRFSSTNLSAFTEKECKRAKLDASETADVQEFSKLATEKKLTKIYTKLLATQKKLVKLEDDKNVWEGPSKALRGNIAKYAHAVLLSPNLHGYREKVPINHVLTIIKRLRFDLPRNVEKNRSHWATVETAVSNALTSKRRFFKDEVKHSGANDIDIYTLTERIIGDSEVNMSLELVARVAMMRSLYFEEEKTESDFWVEMDKLLAHIRTEAKGDKLAASHAMKWFIDEDMKKYGIQEGEDLVEERELDEEAPAWFEEVNKVVAGNGKRT